MLFALEKENEILQKGMDTKQQYDSLNLNSKFYKEAPRYLHFEDLKAEF